MARPFLKWAGGKTQLLPQLLAAVPAEIDTYYEPFLGGAALFFALEEKGAFERAVLADINPDLINAYTQVRDKAGKVIVALRRHQREYLSRNEKRRADYYYEVRSEHRRRSKRGIHAAARLLFLNKTCFNGLYRVNSRGEFNVPHGRYENPAICDEDNIHAASAALQAVDLQCSDFADVVQEAGRNDFIYFDPPYVPLSATANFTAYAKSDFGIREQRRLAFTATELARRGVRSLLSNSGHDQVRELYKAGHISVRAVNALRMINSNADARGEVSEHLIQAEAMPPSRRSPASIQDRARRTTAAKDRGLQGRSRGRLTSDRPYIRLESRRRQRQRARE